MFVRKDWMINGRVFTHVLFWSIITSWLTFLFAIGTPSYAVALHTVLFLLPVHLIYFYVLGYIIIPRYLYTRRFFPLVLSFLGICMFSLFAYRLIEIFFADPYYFGELSKIDPSTKWKRLQGSFWDKLLDKQYLMQAFEQSNTIVWGALVVKFFRMWYERKQVALQAELNFLKSQIHPHFLFNTLNNLYALTLRQSPKSPDVVMGLSEILRYMLYECNADFVPLKRDIAIVKSYIALEQLRYEDRLHFNFTLNGEIGEQRIAPLLMIPLVENAFKHGASEMIEEAWVSVDIDVDPHRLKFKIANGKPLKNIEPELPFGKIGIQNLKKRLALIYPENHRLDIYEEEGVYLVVMEIHFEVALSSTVIVEKQQEKFSRYASPSLDTKTNGQ